MSQCARERKKERERVVYLARQGLASGVGVEARPPCQVDGPDDGLPDEAEECDGHAHVPDLLGQDLQRVDQVTSSVSS